MNEPEHHLPVILLGREPNRDEKMPFTQAAMSRNKNFLKAETRQQSIWAVQVITSTELFSGIR